MEKIFYTQVTPNNYMFFKIKQILDLFGNWDRLMPFARLFNLISEHTFKPKKEKQQMIP